MLKFFFVFKFCTIARQLTKFYTRYKVLEILKILGKTIKYVVVLQKWLIFVY